MRAQADYYDHYWSDEELFLRNELDPAVRRILASVVGPAAACLDLGCGDGKTAGAWLASRCGSYTGVDVSQEAVDKARARGLDARKIDDASELPFADAGFDLVVCLEVLEHLFQPAAAAREVLRVLRPGGTLVATVPNVSYWKRRVESIAGRWNPMGDNLSVAQPWRDPHIRFFNPRIMRRMLECAGFERIEVRGHRGCLVHDLPYVPRLVRERTASSLYRRLERRFPAMLGWRLDALARKPAAPVA